MLSDPNRNAITIIPSLSKTIKIMKMRSRTIIFFDAIVSKHLQQKLIFSVLTFSSSLFSEKHEPFRFSSPKRRRRSSEDSGFFALPLIFSKFIKK